VNTTLAWPSISLSPAAGLSLARQPAVWSAVLAFLLYLPPAVSVLQLDPDAVEHIDLARRFIAGEGYVLGIKAYHVGGTEVVHNGLDERAPLYPLLAAAVLSSAPTDRLRTCGRPRAIVLTRRSPQAGSCSLCAVGYQLRWGPSRPVGAGKSTEKTSVPPQSSTRRARLTPLGVGPSCDGPAGLTETGTVSPRFPAVT
jgi:hypothetical protein